ncbi:TatD family hydrolase [Dongshaea marina]|uniref:TatD family hydrolase n=1 Tax=Dongshaea marina TaxID=2047966 RepID=UPI000D3E2427|nr:TatD family hydrolase [Dongshaea marina]
MLLVDSHCHLDRLLYCDELPSLEAALKQASQRGVGLFLSVGVTLDGFAEMIKLVEPYPSVHASCGVHPLSIADGVDMAQLREYAAHPKVVAIGETGLDYYYAQNQAEQQQAFAGQIELAAELAKPLIIHSRDANADTIALLKAHGGEKAGGVIHCFTGDQAMAEQALELGFYISFSGIISFNSAQALRDVAASIPLERLLVETDSPYLAPVPYRGQSNRPAYTRVVAEKLAELKGIGLEELAEITTNNYLKLFSIRDPQPFVVD